MFHHLETKIPVLYWRKFLSCTIAVKGGLKLSWFSWPNFEQPCQRDMYVDSWDDSGESYLEFAVASDTEKRIISDEKNGIKNPLRLENQL